jgi:hypothetical protein
MTGVPIAPKATGAVFAIKQRPDAASGEKPIPIKIAPVTATGVPEACCAFKKCAESKGDQQKLQPAILRDAGNAVLQDLEMTLLQC